MTKREGSRRLCGAVVLLLLAVAGCSTDTVPDPIDAEVEHVADYLAGWFDSSAQAEADEAFLNIRLVMIPIWPDRMDGRWLYVEQAASSALARPYRQRVYHVHRDASGVLRSDVYTLPDDPLAYAACWERDEPMGELRPEDLELRDGCSILLERDVDDTYAGSTVGTGCLSTLRGAAYATSEVTLTPTQVLSWDRGWDENDEQVWGAVKSGYVFDKHGPGAPPRE